MIQLKGCRSTNIRELGDGEEDDSKGVPLGNYSIDPGKWMDD
jgi:hypothetical protein